MTQSTNQEKLYDSPSQIRLAKYKLGDVVKHRFSRSAGVVFDIDPVFTTPRNGGSRSRETCGRPKDQPFYHLFAENAEANTSPMCRSRTCAGHVPASRSSSADRRAFERDDDGEISSAQHRDELTRRVARHQQHVP